MTQMIKITPKFQNDEIVTIVDLPSKPEDCHFVTIDSYSWSDSCRLKGRLLQVLSSSFKEEQMWYCVTTINGPECSSVVPGAWLEIVPFVKELEDLQLLSKELKKREDLSQLVKELKKREEKLEARIADFEKEKKEWESNKAKIVKETLTDLIQGRLQPLLL